MMTATEQLALLREVAEIERPFLNSPDWSPQDTYLLGASTCDYDSFTPAPHEGAD